MIGASFLWIPVPIFGDLQNLMYGLSAGGSVSHRVHCTADLPPMWPWLTPGDWPEPEPWSQLRQPRKRPCVLSQCTFCLNLTTASCWPLHELNSRNCLIKDECSKLPPDFLWIHKFRIYFCKRKLMSWQETSNKRLCKSLIITLTTTPRNSIEISVIM